MRLADGLRQSGAALLDLLLPRACAACARPLSSTDAGVICGRCWSRVVQLPEPRCARCGHPGVREPCRWCAGLPPFVRAGRSVCWYPGGTASSIVRALKYSGWRPVAAGLAERMGRVPWPGDVVAERTALVPVPLERDRERERGFNQSTLIARELGARWGIPVWEDVLVRSRRTVSQTRLTPEDRRHNVSGAFQAPATSRARLRAAHLVLVDDVVTTGATISECAATLFRAGARIISFQTFGRAPATGDRA